MPASLASGAYTLLAIFESSSRCNSWYRVLRHNTTNDLSCDCPAWIFTKNSTRSCIHTEWVEHNAWENALASRLPCNETLALQELDAKWHGGLQGTWTFEQKSMRFANKGPYQIIESTLRTGAGNESTCFLAFSQKFALPDTRLYGGVAAWCGYAHAASIARIGGFPMAGQLPEFYKAPKVARTARERMNSFMRLTEQVDLGDGRTPEQRSEETLQMFLGDDLYQSLEQNHFLDVSSYLFPQRVYRLRRDPYKRHERRVRVFENGRYVHDYCIVRNQSCPEGDFFLGNFLAFLSDEAERLQVVQRYNIFGPKSDGYENETIPVIWQARTA